MLILVLGGKQSSGGFTKLHFFPDFRALMLPTVLPISSDVLREFSSPRRPPISLSFWTPSAPRNSINSRSCLSDTPKRFDAMVTMVINQVVVVVWLLLFSLFFTTKNKKGWGCDDDDVDDDDDDYAWGDLVDLKVTSRWPQKLDQLYCDEQVGCAAAAALSHITEKNNEKHYKQFDSHVSKAKPLIKKRCDWILIATKMV